ncbi:MAG: hypothetical protein CMJ23_07855 [Phycisphaerae bacterium]|nr:hypothetical protein [Phycisphaerae bacterium]
MSAVPVMNAVHGGDRRQRGGGDDSRRADGLWSMVRGVRGVRGVRWFLSWSSSMGGATRPGEARIGIDIATGDACGMRAAG